MSEEDVEVVRGFVAFYEGGNMVPRMREAVERLGADPQPDAVLAYWAEDPAFQYLHPDIEWDSRVRDMSVTARGPREVSLSWLDWLEVWESYVVRVLEYRDLGDWVLVRMDARGRGREGIAVEMRVFRLYQVRDGKIAVYRAFRDEQEALEAAGLRE